MTAEDLGVAGAMTVLLRDAIKPNLLQTLEGGPAFVHCRAVRATSPTATTRSSPTGWRSPPTTSSAPRPASGPTWAPRSSSTSSAGRPGSRPDAAVVVATVRALKMHGGVGKIVAGKPLDPALLEENVEAVRTGAANLAKQIENVTMFGVPAVVAINSFPTDTPAEVEAIREVALAAGARDAVVATHFVDGGAGRGGPRRGGLGGDRGRRAPTSGCSTRTRCRSARRSRRSSTEIYGGDGVEFLPAARKSLKQYEDLGYGHLPICMAKTQYSLSHDATLKGRPTGFTVPIREVRLSAGAGFITPLVRRDADDAGPAVASRAARRSTSTPTGTSSGCSRPGLGRRRARLAARRGDRREREADRDADAEQRARATPAPQAATSIGPSGSSSAWAWSSWPWSSP